jgi:drug/metabolite transporter (DMT)-like permease
LTTNWKLGLGFSLLTVLMWGLLPIALKSVLEVMDPWTISWYRFSISALVALLWYGARSGPALKRLLSRQHRLLSAVAVLGLLSNYLFYIWGLDHINPAATQILIQLAPLLFLISSVILFKEHFSGVQWLGVLGLIVGMLLFFHQRLTNIVLTSETYLAGVALIFSAAVTWCVYGLAQKKLQSEHNAKNILLLIYLAGTILFLPLAEPQNIVTLTPTKLALLIFCGLNTIIAYGSFGLAMSHWESSRVSAILPLAPLLTLLFTYGLNLWALGDIPAEPMDWLTIFGALLVVGSSAVAALPRHKTTS